MGEPALATIESGMKSRTELDQIFLEIFEALGQSALDGASSCTSAVFDLSSSYIEKPAVDSLRKFHELYFAKGDIADKKDLVNSEVDDMFEYLQNKLAAGENIDEGADYLEQEESKQRRLSMSGVQKQIEGLITLDSGIREKILPALASMQFEDAIRQRLSHVVEAWRLVANALQQNLSPAAWSDLARQIANKLSSVEETQSFYELVLNEKAPEGNKERSIFIEF
ncbi:MAG: hypothetical protein NTX25_00650 [Proteobacteria bacterium]|nr:hypothetical protein [Pseudomonadota bacterium]